MMPPHGPYHLLADELADAREHAVALALRLEERGLGTYVHYAWNVVREVAVGAHIVHDAGGRDGAWVFVWPRLGSSGRDLHWHHPRWLKTGPCYQLSWPLADIDAMTDSLQDMLHRRQTPGRPPAKATPC
ncbi:hypothetical protein [Spirillospora sp. NPDC047279]|uniref:hypothetical protein n=1 Tax=Spirillospora sp. NPDC047279 TaxID=3155478 RepID=UPI0033D95690